MVRKERRRRHGGGWNILKLRHYNVGTRTTSLVNIPNTHNTLNLLQTEDKDYKIQFPLMLKLTLNFKQKDDDQANRDKPLKR